MTQRRIDVVVVGAGFAGLRALHTLREQGLEVVVLEAGAGAGGVWFWNRYPGARCDVESYDYSYSFSPELEQEWRWSERYATQPEILRYVEHVVKRFDLRRDIRFHTRMTDASYDEDTHRWSVATDTGETWDAQYLIMATGQLSMPKDPDLPGQDTYRGTVLHTARWPHEGVDLSGKRVGVIGTGSSGTQSIPIIAREAAHVTVFQRTPNFSIPANNAPISDEEDSRVKAAYAARREQARNSPSGLGFVPTKTSALDVDPAERDAHYEEQWKTAGFGFLLAYPDLILDQRANDTAADFIRRKIADKVESPEMARLLTPVGYPFGAKRPPVDSGYFETFNRSNVTLVDIASDPITGFSPTGLLTEHFAHDLDVVVFATGFDVMTGALFAPRITGRGGLALREAWVAGPQTYLGLTVHDFPNMFIIAGPGSPSLLSNVMLSIEQHVDWLADLLNHAREIGADEIEAEEQAQRDWVHEVNTRAETTLYPRAKSYYMGDEVAGKPRVFTPFVGGVRGYRRICEQVAADGYRGIRLRVPSASSPASSSASSPQG